jgi:hypothetical protein
MALQTCLIAIQSSVHRKEYKQKSFYVQWYIYAYNNI